MPGNYTKREAPICPQCHARTNGIDTNVYFCSQCSIELSYNYQLHMLNVYSLTDDGERIPQGNVTYATTVAENMSMPNIPAILSSREITRLTILKMVADRTLQVKKAAGLLNMSWRQVYRLRNRFMNEGETSLRDGHDRSGRRPLPADFKIRIIALARSDYAGLSLRQLQAVLSQQGINLHYSTIDRVLQGGMN